MHTYPTMACGSYNAFACTGYGIFNDLRMLWESYPDNHAYRRISAGIDLKDASKVSA